MTAWWRFFIEKVRKEEIKVPGTTNEIFASSLKLKHKQVLYGQLQIKSTASRELFEKICGNDIFSSSILFTIFWSYNFMDFRKSSIKIILKHYGNLLSRLLIKKIQFVYKFARSNFKIISLFCEYYFPLLLYKNCKHN